MSSWPVKPFGELTENFDSVRVPVKESERKPGPYPYYGASGVVDRVDGYLFDGEYLLVAEDGENLKTRQTPIAFIATGKFWVNNHAHIVRASKNNVTRYLMYAMREADIASFLTGSTMPKLTQGNMNRVLVVAPPRETQEAIAHILGTLDDKIELNRRMNETLEAMARALFKSWFVDFDPVRAKSEGRQPSGMDAETAKLFPSEFVESELGRIPKGWRAESIGACGDIITGKTPSKAEPNLFGMTYPFIKIPDMRGRLWVSTAQDGLSKAGHEGQPGKLVPPRSIAVSCIATVGLVALVRYPSHTNQQINTIVPKDAAAWAWLLFALRELSPQIEARSLGGSVTKNLNKGQFESVPLLIPPRPLVRTFEVAVGPLLELAARHDDAAHALGTLRNQLLPRLLSGELSVAHAEREAEAVA